MLKRTLAAGAALDMTGDEVTLLFVQQIAKEAVELVWGCTGLHSRSPSRRDRVN
jgi:dihydrodipicolinate reductase